MASGSSLLIRNAAEIVSVDEDGIHVTENGAIAFEDGEVLAFGDSDELISDYPVDSFETTIDADGNAVIPGFVDPHTHSLYEGDRSDEFAAKLRGKSYQEILSEGGGILRTVSAVRAASFDELLDTFLTNLDSMLAHGTTTVEVKSGYGLDTESELKMLEVIEKADSEHPIDVIPTYLGAHAIPDEQDQESYVDSVIDEQLPAVADQGVAEYIDVFCDDGVFTPDESRRILEAGLEAGLKPKIHTDEFARLGGSQLAASLSATSADHLLQATAEDAEAMAEAGVSPVFLPGTAFSIGASYADYEIFEEAGADVAVATDFNPNCHSPTMQFAITLACIEMGMSPEDALVAATRNAALALDRSDGLGTLQPGTPGDAVILDAPSYLHIPYRFAVNTVDTVIKDGSPVYRYQTIGR